MRPLVRLVAFGLCAAATLASSPALAEVKRYALLIGADRGHAHEVPLRFAESDVDAVATTLEDVAGYASERIVRLKAPTAARVREVIVDLNLTIQRDVRAGAEAVLFVFYSGHGDGATLHLGGSELGTEELSKLVRLAPAKLKLLVLDACRAGTLTRVKGGRQVAPFQIGLTEELRNEGYAVVTSSAAGEDAQESDDLRSSIFTHHFLTALRGPGDGNGDGVVTLGETYAYAYEQSLRASMTTVAGSQHATFDYDMRGRADPVLSDLRARGKHARLLFGSPGEYLVMATGGGPLYWEATARTAGATLLLPPGAFRVRLRTRSNVYEMDVSLAEGQSQTVETRDMKPLPLAQVVRKGQGYATLAMGPAVMGSVHGPLGNGFSSMLGAQVGVAIDLPRISLVPRLGFGSGESASLPTGVRSHRLRELSLELSALYPVDIGNVTLAPLVSLGAATLFQTVERGDGCAQDCSVTRSPRGLVTSVGGWGSLAIGHGFSVEASAELVSYYLGRQSDTTAEGASTRSGTLTYRAGLGLGYRY